MGDPTSGATPGGTSWAVPDAKPIEAIPRAAVTPASPPSPHPSARGAGPVPVPVPLRPMAALERVDGGLRVLRLAPATVLAVTALTVVPVQLAGALVPDDPTAQVEPMVAAWLGRGATIVAAEDGDRLPLGLALLGLESVALAVATAALAILVVGWYHGERRGTSAVLAGAGASVPALLATWVVVHVAELVFGLALVVPAALPMVWFAVVAPVVAVEGLGPLAALRRSVALARGRLALVAGACASIALGDLALRGALTAPALLWTDLGLPAERIVAAAVGVGARLVSVPMVAGAVVLLYLDLRVRADGFDLDLAGAELWPDDWARGTDRADG